MKALLDALAHEWVWTRPRLMARRWELRSGDDVIATLEARSWLGTRMSGETSGGRWDLRHEGLFLGRTVVRRAGETAEHLVFRPRWFGAGDVTCPDGTTLRWKRGDFLGRRWELLDADGHLQIEYARRPAFFKSSTRVAASDAGRKLAALPELVLLGFFLVRMLERQSQTSG